MPKLTVPGLEKTIPSRWMVLLLVAGAILCPRLVSAASGKTEYQVKAAFLHNFARFVEWPQHKLPQGDAPIVIGVLGEDPFGTALDAITQKPVEQHRITIKRFVGFNEDTEQHPQAEEMRLCHMLFVATDQRPYVDRIAAMLRNDAVLTISEQPNFIDRGE